MQGDTKLRAILHADIVDSTRLVQRNEGVAHERIRACFQASANTIEAYGGRVEELRGDALVAVFDRASDGVVAALSSRI